LIVLTAAVLVPVFAACAAPLGPAEVEGTYWGIVPCADCEGIETRISLEKSGAYMRQTRYLGDEEGKWFEDAGSFSLEGRILTLQGMLERSAPPYYAIGKDTLTQLDMEGNPITGEFADNYVLKKE
jgi:uncharacterized lipoprotein NlpE involved in copper resistance